MTNGQFNKLINKLRQNKLTPIEAVQCAEIIDTFVEICDEVQQESGDIFGTEGWEHRIGID